MVVRADDWLSTDHSVAIAVEHAEEVAQVVTQQCVLTLLLQQTPGTTENCELCMRSGDERNRVMDLLGRVGRDDGGHAAVELGLVLCACAGATYDREGMDRRGRERATTLTKVPRSLAKSLNMTVRAR